MYTFPDDTYAQLTLESLNQKCEVSLLQCLQASLMPIGLEPTLKDAVACRAANAFRLVQFETAEADMSVPLVKVTLEM